MATGQSAVGLGGRSSTPRVAILGAGAAGLCMAMQLQQARDPQPSPSTRRPQGVGGTWRDNTYPGAACDVPSHLYSFSFAPKTDWTRKFAEQPEILGLLRVAGGLPRPAAAPAVRRRGDRGDLGRRRQAWELRTVRRRGDRRRRRGLGSGAAEPSEHPGHPGARRTSRARCSTPRAGTTTTTCGASVWRSSASARAPSSSFPGWPQQARHTDAVPAQRQLRRSQARPGVPAVGTLAARTTSPPLRRAYRASIYWRFEARFALMRKGSRLGRLLRDRFGKELGKLVSSKLPREALIPDYTPGCRRILIANDWYPTLLRPDVDVVTDARRRDHRARGPHRRPATSTTVDTIIFGTGFRSTEFLSPLRITGRDGAGAERGLGRRRVCAIWGWRSPGSRTCSCCTGPNTNLGHNSILFMIEQQVGYIRSLLVRHGRATARSSAEVTDGGDGLASTTEIEPRRGAHRVGRGLPQLVQDRLGTDHEQLARLHRSATGRRLAPTGSPGATSRLHSELPAGPSQTSSESMNRSTNARVAHPAHRREQRQDLLAVAGLGQPRVADRHDAAVGRGADEPAHALGELHPCGRDRDLHERPRARRPARSGPR